MILCAIILSCYSLCYLQCCCYYLYIYTYAYVYINIVDVTRYVDNVVSVVVCVLLAFICFYSVVVAGYITSVVV